MNKPSDPCLTGSARLWLFGMFLAGAWTLSAAPAKTFAVQPGDVEPNEVVDLRDLLAIRNDFGRTGPPGWIGADLDGNGAVDNADLLIWRQNFPFVGTVAGPYILIANPVDQSIIGDRRPSIIIDYSPTGLNVDPDSLQVIVDGVDFAAAAIKNARHATVLLDDALADGPHFVQASISDVGGTSATARSDFQVTSITLLPNVSPVVGPAPLTPVFSPDVVWADVAPAFYQWDWQNDGSFEITDPRPDLRTNTFNDEGLHTIRFQVQQSNGALTSTTLQVAVTEQVASVSPSNGAAPLTAFLHGIAADIDDPITLYEWDFDYVGSFAADYSSAANPNAVHLYFAPGVYHPVFRTTHQSGAVVEHPIVQQELQVTSASAPLAIAAAAQGGNALTVNFSGTGSDDGTLTLYEWDFENDGVWDYSSPTTGVTSHTYPAAGVKLAAFRVTDNEGNSTIDRVQVETFAPATLEVLDDTVTPNSGETVTIRTTLTIDSTVDVYIRTRDGRRIATLVDDEPRSAGTYDDTWDGRDFRYEPCHPGAYYAVLEYTYPGRTDRVDLTETTGGTHYFASMVGSNPSQVDPFADSFLMMTYAIPSASRASLYILPGGTNRTNTLFDNLALGAGNYTDFWSGLTSAGQYAAAVSYLWSVNAWTLGDNAIVVKGRPEITGISVEPNYFNPTDAPSDSTEGAQLQFSLNNTSTVIVRIIRMQNRTTLRSFLYSWLEPGDYSIQWDGLTNSGQYPAAGDYDISIVAVDENGNIATQRHGVMRIYY